MERFMKSNLDIAMFGHKRIPSREGGIEIVVEELCTRMVNKGTINIETWLLFQWRLLSFL